MRKTIGLAALVAASYLALQEPQLSVQEATEVLLEDPILALEGDQEAGAIYHIGHLSAGEARRADVLTSQYQVFAALHDLRMQYGLNHIFVDGQERDITPFAWSREARVMKTAEYGGGPDAFYHLGGAFMFSTFDPFITLHGMEKDTTPWMDKVSDETKKEAHEDTIITKIAAFLQDHPGEVVALISGQRNDYRDNLIRNKLKAQLYTQQVYTRYLAHSNQQENIATGD